jgi:hypothetical protein
MKRILIIGFAILAFVILFQRFLYRNLVSYHSVGLRSGRYPVKPALAKFIDSSSSETKIKSIEDVVEVALETTTDHLSYATSHTQNDPNRLIFSKNAHCVGYANFFAATCSYLLQVNKLNENWKVETHQGKLHILTVDIHKFFSSPFLKDHDFVILSNKANDRVIAVDPTLSDYSWIEHVSYRK